MKHLQKLADAGLTHLHLLPTYQFGDVDDEKENWKYIGMGVTDVLSAYLIDCSRVRLEMQFPPLN